jgi:biotin carboxylase
MCHKILILGAGEFMVPAIMTAKNMGLTVITTDRNSGSPGFAISDHHEIVDITDIAGTKRVASQYKVDGIIPLNDLGIITASAVCEDMGFIGVSPEVAHRCTDKRAMREKWHRDGVPCPKFRIVGSMEETRDAAEDIGLPVIIKPPDSMGGSRGMRKVDALSELDSAFDYGMKYAKHGELLVEEYVFGDECSVESVSHNRLTGILGISDKTKLPPPYRVDKSVTYPTLHPPDVIRDIKAVARDAAESLGIKDGPGHLELSVTPKGIRLFEMGARTGGGGIIPAIQVPAVYGINMMEQVIRIAVGEKPDIGEREPMGGSDLRFITPKPGTVRGITGLDTALAIPGVARGALFVKMGDTVKPVQSGGDRAGYVVTTAQTRGEAVSIADKAELSILVETEN